MIRMWFDDSFFEEFRRIHREMDRLFRHMNVPGRYPALPHIESAVPAHIRDSNFRVPITDLRETESGFIAAIELPGVEKEDIELDVSEHAITVRVEKKEERKVEKEEEGIFRHAAISRQFFRQFPLPAEVQPEKAKAVFENGILRVEVPKKDAGKDSFRVDIE